MGPGRIPKLSDVRSETHRHLCCIKVSKANLGIIDPARGVPHALVIHLYGEGDGVLMGEFYLVTGIALGEINPESGMTVYIGKVQLTYACHVSPQEAGYLFNPCGHLRRIIDLRPVRVDGPVSHISP